MQCPCRDLILCRRMDDEASVLYEKEHGKTVYQCICQDCKRLYIGIFAVFIAPSSCLPFAIAEAEKRKKQERKKISGEKRKAVSEQPSEGDTEIVETKDQ